MANPKPKQTRKYSKREITIKIVGQSKDDTGDSEANEESKRVKNILSNLMHPLKTAENKLLGKHYIMKYTVDRAFSLVKNNARFSFNKYLNLSENYLLENNLEEAKSVIDFTTGLGTSILTGVQLGSAGGAPGMALGAIAGATSYIAGSAISYEQKRYGYLNTIAASTYQNEYSQIRAGLVDGGRNTNE